jgi:hypothetical protein
MSQFTKFASAAALVASLAPFAAHARTSEPGNTHPANHAVQSSQPGAFAQQADHEQGSSANHNHFPFIWGQNDEGSSR